MQIIQSSPKFTDEQIDAELRKVVMDSLQTELNTQQEREVIARSMAKAMKGHKTIPGLGKCVAVMPAREFFRLQAKYGTHEVHSKEFLRDFNKRFPELSPNRV